MASEDVKLLINGKEYKWENENIQILGIPMGPSITEVSYKDRVRYEGTITYDEWQKVYDLMPNKNPLKKISKRPFSNRVHKRLPRAKKKWLTTQLWQAFQYKLIPKQYLSMIYNGDFKLS